MAEYSSKFMNSPRLSVNVFIGSLIPRAIKSCIKKLLTLKSKLILNSFEFLVPFLAEWEKYVWIPSWQISSRNPIFDSLFRKTGAQKKVEPFVAAVNIS